MKTETQRPTRRTFLRGAAAAAATVSILPRHVLAGGADAPSEKLNIAGIGVGGMGGSNLAACATENIVALCDVDSTLRRQDLRRVSPGRQAYKDFRVMFDKQKDIDAVIVATPDHTHAVVALAAIEQGKHVYVQKPLAHRVEEARRLTEAARQAQGHQPDGQPGPLRRRRPADLRMDLGRGHRRGPRGARLDESARVAAGHRSGSAHGNAARARRARLGPVDRSRPPCARIIPTYHPGNWRAWWDFGTGSLGDLGCHILDAPFWALKLKYPVSVEGCISTYWKRPVEAGRSPKNETVSRARRSCATSSPPAKACPRSSSPGGTAA